jgi:hypothetical protein
MSFSLFRFRDNAERFTAQKREIYILSQNFFAVADC